jgi:ribosomal protein L32
MSFAPQKQASRTQTGQRYGKWLKLKAKKLKDAVVLQYDAQGKAIALAHFASPITGEYKGRKVYNPGKKSKVTTLKA